MIIILYTRFYKKLAADLYLHYLNSLPAGIQKNIESYYKWEDAQRSLFGKLLLIEGLKNFGITNHSLENLMYSEYKRPYLNNIDFNISHSGEFVICAISKNNKVGIDVEEINEIPADEFEEQFSDTELAAIRNDKSFRHFYTLWTQKEAFLKAIGKGLYVPLNQVAIKDNKIYWEGKDWFMHEVKLDTGYVSYLCTDTDKPDTIIGEISF